MRHYEENNEGFGLGQVTIIQITIELIDTPPVEISHKIKKP